MSFQIIQHDITKMNVDVIAPGDEIITPAFRLSAKHAVNYHVDAKET